MWVLKPAIPIKFGFRKLPQLAASFIRELVGKRRPLAFPATMALQMVQAAPIPTPAVLQISQQFFSRKFAYQAMIRPFPALGLSAFLVHARQSRLRIGIASSPGPHLSLIASYFQSARSTAGVTVSRNKAMSKSKTEKRFDQLLQAMVTQPVPSGKPATKARTSKQADAASYGDTRTRAGKAASASSKPKRKSR
jgi:hypothetical protein